VRPYGYIVSTKQQAKYTAKEAIIIISQQCFVGNKMVYWEYFGSETLNI
jgi:hypothetical protein